MANNSLSRADDVSPPPPFEGAENYPLNLPGLNSHFEDGEAYKNRLQTTATTLFSAKVDFQILDASSNNNFKDTSTYLKNAQAAEDHLLKVPKSDYFRLMWVSRAYCVSLSRKDSLSAFWITADLLRKILTIHAVPLTFLDLLFGFRNRSELSEKGYGAWAVKKEGNAYEICYQLKYTEFNGRRHGDPWSERQIGVYHRFLPAAPVEGLLILLNARPESNAQKRVERVFSQGQYTRHSVGNALRLHSVIVSTYLDNWRWHLDDLGAECLRMEDKGFTTALKGKGDPTLTFERLIHLRNLESKFIKATAIIKATLSVIASLETFRKGHEQERLTHVSSDQLESDMAVAAQEQSDLKAEADHFATCLTRCENYLTSIEVMRQRIRVQIDLVADGVDEKGQLTARDISKNLLSLTKKSVSDNATVLVVTLITLIYLPTQLVATCLGMNVISYQTETSTIRLANDFWLFGAFAGPLTILTLVGWGAATWWEMKRKDKAQRDEDEEEKDTYNDEK